MEIKKIIFLCFAVCIICQGQAYAGLQPEDFSCRGLYLGDSKEKVLHIFGEYITQEVKPVWGKTILYYEFKDDFVVGMDESGKVVDMAIKNKDYEAREGIKYGATPYLIETVYGKKKRVFLEGRTYYIYENAKIPAQHLVLHVESVEGYLLDFRITSLPLAEDDVELDMSSFQTEGSVQLVLH